MKNAKRIESAEHALTGYITIPRWLTPSDLHTWFKTAREIDERLADVLRQYAPLVREWHLDLLLPDGEVVPIRSRDDALAFDDEPPYQLVNLLATHLRPLIDTNFFGLPSSQPLSETSTATDANPQSPTSADDA